MTDYLRLIIAMGLVSSFFALLSLPILNAFAGAL